MPTTTTTNKFLVVVAMVVEMVMVGKMGTDTYSKYNVFSSKVFIMPSGSVGGIFVVLMINGFLSGDGGGPPLEVALVVGLHKIHYHY